MSPQASWILQEEIVPRLNGAVPSSVRCIGAEDAEELIADGIAIAARMVDRLERQGKLKKVTPGNVAYYTIQHLKSGRRANGTSSVDIMASATQLNGSTRLHSLSEVVAQSEAGEEILELHDVISLEEDDPAQKAARKMDWEFFLACLTSREKAVVEYLLLGKNMSELARNLGLDRSTIQYFKNRLADKILDYMGHDILKEVRRMPGWKNSLNAERERLACRADRRH